MGTLASARVDPHVKAKDLFTAFDKEVQCVLDDLKTGKGERQACLTLTNDQICKMVARISNMKKSSILKLVAHSDSAAGETVANERGHVPDSATVLSGLPP